jgi:hypothetical protein
MHPAWSVFLSRWGKYVDRHDLHAVHAGLLERATCLNPAHGGGSMTVKKEWDIPCAGAKPALDRRLKSSTRKGLVSRPPARMEAHLPRRPSRSVASPHRLGSSPSSAPAALSTPDPRSWYCLLPSRPDTPPAHRVVQVAAEAAARAHASGLSLARSQSPSRPGSIYRSRSIGRGALKNRHSNSHSLSRSVIDGVAARP